MKIYADGMDITDTVGNLAWKNAVAELSTTMTFDIAKDLGEWTSIYLPEKGGIISYVTNEEVFRGIVLSVDDGDKAKNSYTVADFGFYLNKNQETYQFNGISANAAIQQMSSDFGIPIESMCDIGYTVKKIYFDKSVSEIIKDILELAKAQTGYEYNFDVTPNGMRIYRIGDIIANPTFRVAVNLPPTSSVEQRGGVSHKTSIEEMKNSVKVITGNDDGYQLRAISKDDTSISKYGLLQTVEKVDDDKVGTAQSVANSKLAELNICSEEFSFEIIEEMDSYTRAGSLIVVDGAYFLIESSEHSIEKGTHKVKLTLKRKG